MAVHVTHTPGAWKVSGPDDEPYGDILVGIKGQVVCRLSQDDAPVHDYNDEQWANARLIAAAPDLLAACEMHVAARIDPEKYKAKDAIREAIAKARHGFTPERNS